MNQLLPDIANALVDSGVGVEMLKHGYGILDGFYKSDGCAYLVPSDNGGVHLRTRYGQIDQVESIADVVKVSRKWFEYSKNRFEGWRTPPSHWQTLYDKYTTQEEAA